MKLMKKSLILLLSLVMLMTTCVTAIPFTASADNLSSQAGYANVAKGKSYVTSSLANSSGTIPYPDENSKTMTDGVIASATASYSNAAYMAFPENDSLSRNGYGSITVDLGGLYKLDKFVAHVGTSYGSNGAAGIYAPQLMWVYVSTDKENWYKAGKVVPTEDNSKSSMAITLQLEESVTARYVEFRLVDSKMWKRWIFVSEVEAYGISTSTAIPYPEVDELKFLFVGNSATYYFHNPVKFMLIAESAGINVDITYCTIGSSYMSNFADATHSRCGAPLREKLAEKQYDYIVIHDNSNADYDKSQPAMETLMPLFEANGAEVMLYKRYSSNTNASLREGSAYKHHINYTKLASNFGIDKVAPVADAFLISTDKYPSINLHHTDNSHHNDTSSYLIALVWAKTFLNIDLSKVTYTAGLSTAIANNLKDVANIACAEGYAFPDLCYTENGTTYRNVAAGKSYVSDGSHYTGDTEWNDKLTNGTVKGKLTDTALAASGEDGAIACYIGKTVNYTIDLEGYYNVKAVKADMFGNTSWGIKHPSDNSVKVAVSTDGVTFTDIGSATRTDGTSDGNWTTADFTLKTNKDDLVARYVRVTYVNNNDVSTPFWSSDIRVFGTASDYQPELPPVVDEGNLAYGKSYTTSEIYSENGVVLYPDENGTTLTDGRNAASDALYNDAAFVGFNYNSDDYKENGYAYITVDLGQLYSVDKFNAKVASKLNQVAGIYAPSNVEVYVSEDNSTWTKAGSVVPVDTDTVSTIDATIELDTGINARYVQFRFTAGVSWMFVSEVEVYGGDYDPSTPTPDPDPDPTGIIGDVDNSGTVDSVDYLLVKRFCFNTYTLSIEEKARANVNSDDKIDSVDYVLVKRIAFGTYTAQ